MTQQPSHIIAAPMQVAPAPIRVIPTHISIRQFSGSDADYTARQFLDLCKAAIVNSSITEDHDKIAFIRSHLLPGSRAFIMMQSSASLTLTLAQIMMLLRKISSTFFGEETKQALSDKLPTQWKAYKKMHPQSPFGMA